MRGLPVQEYLASKSSRIEAGAGKQSLRRFADAQPRRVLGGCRRHHDGRAGGQPLERAGARREQLARRRAGAERRVGPVHVVPVRRLGEAFAARPARMGVGDQLVARGGSDREAVRRPRVDEQAARIERALAMHVGVPVEADHRRQRIHQHRWQPAERWQCCLSGVEQDLPHAGIGSEAGAPSHANCSENVTRPEVARRLRARVRRRCRQRCRLRVECRFPVENDRAVDADRHERGERLVAWHDWNGVGAGSAKRVDTLGIGRFGRRHERLTKNRLRRTSRRARMRTRRRAVATRSPAPPVAACRPCTPNGW